eukprot:3004689-Lingulodinium_polyedra.AAC.1
MSATAGAFHPLLPLDPRARLRKGGVGGGQKPEGGVRGGVPQPLFVGRSPIILISRARRTACALRAFATVGQTS